MLSLVTPSIFLRVYLDTTYFVENWKFIVENWKFIIENTITKFLSYE